MKVAGRLLAPAPLPIRPAPELVVNVVCTRFPASLDAMHVASQMARGLGARIAVHLPREIPYPLPLIAPPVAVEFTEQELRSLASGLPLDTSIDTSIQVYLCRDLTETVRELLEPESIVVLGGPKRWWRTREAKLGRILKNDGHHVILTHAD